MDSPGFIDVIQNKEETVQGKKKEANSFL